MARCAFRFFSLELCSERLQRAGRTGAAIPDGEYNTDGSEEAPSMSIFRAVIIIGQEGGNDDDEGHIKSSTTTDFEETPLRNGARP